MTDNGNTSKRYLFAQYHVNVYTSTPLSDLDIDRLANALEAGGLPDTLKNIADQIIANEPGVTVEVHE